MASFLTFAKSLWVSKKGSKWSFAATDWNNRYADRAACRNAAPQTTFPGFMMSFGSIARLIDLIRSRQRSPCSYAM